jgi:hypothetical protein
MKLWTWQTSGFDIRRDHVDVTRSYFRKHAPEQRYKYKLVQTELGTIELVWCYTVEKDWKANRTTMNNRVRWVLEVQTGDVVRFVDDWLADRLLYDQPCPDIATWRRWRREAASAHPHRPDRQNQFIVTNLQTYSGSMLDLAEGWRGFFLEEAESAEGVSALLRCPVSPDWVIEHP